MPFHFGKLRSSYGIKTKQDLQLKSLNAYTHLHIQKHTLTYTYFHATQKRRTCIKMLLQMLRMSSRAKKNVSEVLLLVIYAGGLIIFALYILLH